LSGLGLLHTREQFSVVANAPFEIAWPLFGAHSEQLWAPDWEPVFLWPEKPFDQEGMVFIIRQAEKNDVWFNTTFDQNSGRIQYVYVIPDVVVTVITLKLSPDGRATNVEVIYERTALAVATNERVRILAANDRCAGAEWSRQINSHLGQ
jgi:hypothetical protein